MHRDVSPENVMIASDGHVVLTNFSYAKLLDDCDGAFSSCGDKKFESPERILGWMYDFAVDIWSFGVLLCIMHFGQVSERQEEGTRDSSRLRSAPFS